MTGSRGTAARWLQGAVVLAAATACGDGVRQQGIGGATMGTTYTIKFVAADDAAEVQAEVDATLAEVNALFSTYDPGSEISRFNGHASVEPMPCSEEFATLVGASLRVSALTGGAFDPTLFPVIDLYGFGPTEERKVPEPKVLDAALGHVGWERVHLVGRDAIEKAEPGVQLDLSAMAKGYGVDRVCQVLSRRGITSFMVEIGGEVRCAGVKEDGRPWTIGIEGPGSERGSQIIDTVALLDRAIATSGSYRNYLESGGERVHHIVDPRTGRNPHNGVISVSVLASNCALADALATALMVIGPEGAEKVFADLGGAGLAALFLVETPTGGVTTVGIRW